MTIKPVDAPAQKRGNSADNEKKETIGQVVAEQNPHESRNQSPRRESFDDLNRTRRRSPHKNSRSKRRDHIDQHVPLHLKRDRNERETCQNNITTPPLPSVGLPPPLSGSMSPLLNLGSNSPVHTSSSIASTASTSDSLPGLSNLAENSTANDEASTNLSVMEEKYSGYNSGDEHFQSKDGATAEEWQERDDKFAKCMHDHGYVLKNVEEDGACLFRAISLQIYGDEEMHDVIRQHTMDYIFKNREYFTHFVTEDINNYIRRKRRKDSHGNHIEIQAMSEIYNRPVEVYCYKPTPINIFNSEQINNGYAPLRLSYQRGSHYNAILDPYNATVGVGLGLAGYVPELQTKEACRLSEELAIEQTMFEDKLRSTDWEATNEAIEEQIARESYLQWCRDNLQRSRGGPSSTVTATITAPTATVTSSQAAKLQNDPEPAPSKYSTPQHNNKCPSTITKATETQQTSTFNSILNEMNTTTQAGFGVSIPMATLTATATSTSTSTSTTSSLVQNNTDNDTVAQPMDLSSNNVKALPTSSNNESQNDLGGYASDGTDISSVSSSGYSGGSSSSSPTSSYSDSLKKRKKRSKKLKNVSANENISCSNRKRRCDSDITSLVLNSDKLLNKPSIQINSNTTTANNKPKTDSSSRSRTPDIEQRPSTSKQCCSKILDKTTDKKNEEKYNDNRDGGVDGDLASALPSTSAAKTKSGKDNENSSTFYQELLEASYAADGLGQLSESEMLQKAIQMSTQDYIEDQKRRYLIGP